MHAGCMHAHQHEFLYIQPCDRLRAQAFTPALYLYMSIIHSYLPDMIHPICWFGTHTTNTMVCISSVARPDSYLEVLSHDKQDVLGCLESFGISNA